MRSTSRILLVSLAIVLAACAGAMGAPGTRRVVCDGDTVELHSAAFVFRLNTANGLRAESWKNLATGRTLGLGGGAEVEFDLGLPDKPVVTPKLRVARKLVDGGADGVAAFVLVSDEPAAIVTVTYRWDDRQPVLRKTAEITNSGIIEWNRLLNVRLGTYATGQAKLSGGEQVLYPPGFRGRAQIFGGLQGFPVYAEDEFFFSVAHPAGWATQKPGEISLRHYPGVKVPARGDRTSMEAVYGVGPAGGGRDAFLAHVRSRMRRTVRGHDRPYAIFEPFGARIDGDFNETESFVLDMIGKVAQGQRESDCRFDLFSVDFWVDYAGDLKRADPQRFPNGLAPITAALGKADLKLGLWIDSSICGWSIGGNPATHAAIVQDAYRPGFGNTYFCRATEPIRSMYTRAFAQHVRNGARLLKFDNLNTLCNNPKHEHLPGIYSTEAIIDSVIDCYRELDAASPEVFIMLYWGYRSPWWLMYGDTMFETGVDMEAASPGHMPAPFVRDAVTRKLDQGHVYAKDVPWLGTDSLGVWLSHWPWNSSIGPEHWQPAFVMDLCRGAMLAQPWSDPQWLTPPQRRQMGQLIALLKARPGCFAYPRLILGDPWKYEPYGYCCTDGQRAMVAINNGTWEDRVVTLQLNSAWGLPDGKNWDVYRWYPDVARLSTPAAAGADPKSPAVAMAVRPFDVVLFEVVPRGEPPALRRDWDQRTMPARFDEPSRPVEILLDSPDSPKSGGPQDGTPGPDPAVWKALEITEANSAGGAALGVLKDGSILASGPAPSPDTYRIQGKTDLAAIRAVLVEVLPHNSLPGNGPGRAVNGNFQLAEIRVEAAPAAKPEGTQRVALRNPVADFSQTGYGGWPVAAAVDGDPKTAWSIDPSEGVPHVAIFETAQPVGAAGGTTLRFELVQGDREHSLGRFRLWATSAAGAKLPAGYGAAKWTVRGECPATRQGGLLVVCVELSQDGKPVELHNLGGLFSADATVAGQSAKIQPVLGALTYPSSWQAWRWEVPPGAPRQPFAIEITGAVSGRLDRRFSAHFLPRDAGSAK